MVKKRNKRIVLRRKKNSILLFAVLLILIAVLILVLFFRGGVSGNVALSSPFSSGQEYCQCEMQIYDGGTEPGSLSDSKLLNFPFKADCKEAYSTKDQWGRLEAWVPLQSGFEFPKVKIYNCRRAKS